MTRLVIVQKTSERSGQIVQAFCILVLLVCLASLTGCYRQKTLVIQNSGTDKACNQLGQCNSWSHDRQTIITRTRP